MENNCKYLAQSLVWPKAIGKYLLQVSCYHMQEISGIISEKKSCRKILKNIFMNLAHFSSLPLLKNSEILQKYYSKIYEEYLQVIGPFLSLHLQEIFGIISEKIFVEKTLKHIYVGIGRIISIKENLYVFNPILRLHIQKSLSIISVEVFVPILRLH